MQRYHVAAGAYRTSERRGILLQAYLGTCVGVAIHCQATGIGGIIHLLLPEPVSATNVLHPEKYATTGLPLFLASLLSMGAQRRTMRASLAGGALVGPLSTQDIALDIGGRTADAARTFLASEQIEIAQSETGGFFICSLSLDMTTGRCTIEPAGRLPDEPPALPKQPTPMEIQAAMQRLRPIPQVALKVLRMIDSQTVTIEALADEIRRDQVITARTLSLANSAMFARKRTIETLDHALVYLGQAQLAKLILSAAVESYFDSADMGYSLCKGGLYHHALGCAHVAEAMAVKTKKAAPYQAYMAGLLHDIGKVVLDQYVAPALPFFYRHALAQNHSFLAVEKQALGIGHTEAGARLARQWSLPTYLQNVIRYHHCPEQDREHTNLTVIVHLSDLLLSRFLVNLEIERLDAFLLETRLASLDLGPNELSSLVDLIPGFLLDKQTAGTIKGRDKPDEDRGACPPHGHQ